MSAYDEVPDHPDGGPPEDVELECDVRIRLRCLPEWLSVARAIAADIAVHADFDLDSIDDIKIAVDEAGSQLIGLAGTASGGVSPASDTDTDTMWCHFELARGVFEIRITVAAASPSRPMSLHGRFGWHVLDVVTDEVWSEQVTLSGGGTGTCIAMRKRKAVRQGVPASADRG